MFNLLACKSTWFFSHIQSSIKLGLYNTKKSTQVSIFSLLIFKCSSSHLCYAWTILVRYVLHAFEAVTEVLWPLVMVTWSSSLFLASCLSYIHDCSSLNTRLLFNFPNWLSPDDRWRLTVSCLKLVSIIRFFDEADVSVANFSLLDKLVLMHPFTQDVWCLHQPAPLQVVLIRCLASLNGQRNCGPFLIPFSNVSNFLSSFSSLFSESLRNVELNLLMMTCDDLNKVVVHLPNLSCRTYLLPGKQIGIPGTWLTGKLIELMYRHLSEYLSAFDLNLGDIIQM